MSPLGSSGGIAGMIVFNPKIQKVILLGISTVALAFAYNNCAKMQFSEAPESIASRLNTGATIFINRDAPYTNSKDVSLFIEHNSASLMYVTNDPSCQSGGVWETYAHTRAWTLGTENSETKVFAKFKENSQNSNAPESECYSDSIIHDNIPPVLGVLRAAPALTNAPSFEIKLSASDTLSGVGLFQCTDQNNNILVACDDTLLLSPAADGPGSMTIQVWDRAGNLSLPLIQTWIVDRTPPRVQINAQPSSITNKELSTFEFSGSDNLSTSLTYECRTDSLAFAGCLSPFATSLTAGNHQFFVRAKDQAGNLSAEASYSWKIDLSAPTVELTEKPKAQTNETTALFKFIGSDEGQALSKFECQIDGGAFKTCSSPDSHAGLVQGSHVFALRGYDSVGNVSATLSYSWSVDLSAPNVTITSKPLLLTKETAAVFSFIATDAQTGISSIECSLDSSTFSPCSNNTSVYNGLPAGNHTFQVRATDLTGNISIPVKYQWTVDLMAPTIQILSGPAPLSNKASAQIVLKVTDNNPGTNGIQCRLDNQVYGPCSETVNYAAVSEGPHTFFAKATDTAGNASQEAIYTWTADVTGPAINFGKIPLKTVGVLDTATLEFIVTDSGSGLESVTCGMVGKVESVCPATKLENIYGLDPGVYTYRVTARDRSGNTSTNSVSWTVEYNIRQVTKSIPVTSNHKADILIVIDNSGSMAPEQLNMAQRFSSFLDTLKNLDWQLAIVTTDVDLDSPKRDGRFLELTGLPGSYIISSSMNPITANEAFAKTIQRSPSEGSGNEQGIAATYRAIERSRDATKTVNAPNISFFRPEAALAVLVVSDANETNSLGTQLRNIPQNLFNLVQTTWPNKPFLFHSIIVKSGDTACLAVSGNEGYGVSYEQLSTLTGGIIGNVCEGNYSSQLSRMGTAVTELIKSVTLPCAPLDTNRDGKPDILFQLGNGGAPPGFTLDGLKLTFDSFLPAGQNQIIYTCLK